jgi:hypothetical protein
MRSRFEAFRAGGAAWLLASWHHSNRPGRWYPNPVEER